MKHHLETLFGVRIFPDFDGERETFTVWREGQCLRADSLPALWALLLESVALPVYEWRAAA